MRITKNISVSPERVVQYAITATYLSMLLSCKGQSGPDALQTVTPDINAINSLRQRAIDTLGQDAKYLGESLSSFKVDIPAEPDRSKPASTVSGTIFEIKSESSVMLEANNLTLGLYVPDPNKDPNVNTDPIPVLINHISENPDSLIQTTVEDDNGIKVERYGIAAMPLDEQYLDAFMHGDASVNGPVDKFLKKNTNGDVVPLYTILFNDITKDNVGDFVKELSQLNNSKDIQKAVLSRIYGITFTDFDNDRSIIIKLNNENQKNIKDFIANLFFGSDMVAQAKGLSAEELTAQAASPTPSVLIPSTPTEVPPTATAEATTVLNATDEVKALLEAQKAPYAVNAEGKAVITVDGKEITLDNLVDTKTDFGLAEDILNGLDATTGIRYLYTEKGGWAEVIQPGTPENRTKVNYEDFGNGLVNASAALLYQENPTIPPGVIDDPQYYLQGGGSKEVGGYIATLSSIPVDNNKLRPFTRSTKSFGTPTLWLEFSKDGNDFVAAVQPNKNPTLEDKDQKINLPLTFDQDRFDQKEKGKVDDLVDYLLNDKVNFQLLIAPDSSRSSTFQRRTYLLGLDGILSSANLQKPGELLSLFTPEEQRAVIEMWKKRATVAWGDNIPNSEADIIVSVLPSDLALKPLTADYDNFPWGDIQP